MNEHEFDGNDDRKMTVTSETPQTSKRKHGTIKHNETQPSTSIQANETTCPKKRLGPKTDFTKTQIALLPSRKPVDEIAIVYREQNDIVESNHLESTSTNVPKNQFANAMASKENVTLFAPQALYNDIFMYVFKSPLV